MMLLTVTSPSTAGLLVTDVAVEKIRPLRYQTTLGAGLPEK